MAGYGVSLLLSTNDYAAPPTVYLVSGVISMAVEFSHYDGIQLV